MHIERVPNRNSPPAVLLRQSYREGGKVRKRTLANLSKFSQPKAGFRTRLGFYPEVASAGGQLPFKGQDLRKFTVEPPSVGARHVVPLLYTGSLRKS